MSTLRTNAVESITGTATDFPNSLKIQGTLVPSGSAATEPTSRFPYVVGSVAEGFAEAPIGVAVNNSVFIARGWSPGEKSESTYLYDADRPKSQHNGVTFISPTVPPLSDQIDEDAYKNGAGETDESGVGVFVQIGGTISRGCTINCPEHFAELYDALLYCGQFNIVGERFATDIFINLQAGYQLGKGFYFINKKFYGIEIRSEDSVVPISSAFEFSIDDHYFRFDNCHIPTVRAKFDASAAPDLPSGEGSYAVRLSQCSGSMPAPSGVINSLRSGLLLVGGDVLLQGSDWSGAAEYGVRASNSAKGQLREADVSSCGWTGLTVGGCSVVNANSIKSDGCGSFGGLDPRKSSAINVDSTAVVQCNSSNLNNAAMHAIHALPSSMVSAKGASGQNAGDAAIFNDFGFVDAEEFNANGTGGDGVFCRDGSINARNSSSENCTGSAYSSVQGGRITAIGGSAAGSARGANASQGGHIDIFGTDIRVGATESASDIRIFSGSTINAFNATGGTNATVNELTSSGIIYKDV